MSEQDSPKSHSKQRSSLARQHVQTREAMLQELRSHYAKHGQRVLATVTHAFNQEGSLRKLVHRVTGRIVPKESRQHEVLCEFLVRHGEEVFLRQASVHSGDVPGMALSEGEEPVAAGRGGSSEPKPKRPEQPSKGCRVRLPDGQVIAERRSGEERRTGKDRRKSVKMIYTNRRFGGERRCGKDRRQAKSPPIDPE